MTEHKLASGYVLGDEEIEARANSLINRGSRIDIDAAA